MKPDNKKVKGLGLCSGGLDSILSGLVLSSQGISVHWITFETPFFSSQKARQASRNTKISLIVKNITDVYLEMLKNPNCGYGKYMNPCMDCHALMFQLAGSVMKDKGYDFLFSGEVVGQRPMSQTKQSLRYVEKRSGFDGYIIRPLSAKKLPVTIPEQKGLVNRELLLDIEGRSRKRQIKLAKEYGITDYPSPAGGCLLTDKGYSARLKDLFDHEKACTEKDLYLLKYGRHMRLNPETKIIVGRTQKDNENIEQYYDPGKDILIKVKKFPGPALLMPHGGVKEMVALGASICAGYSKAGNLKPVDTEVLTPYGNKIVRVISILPKETKRFLI